MSALQNDARIALLQSHFNLNNLDSALVGDFAEGLNLFNDVGTDALIRDIKSAPLSEETVLNACISLMRRQLSLYPCTRKSSRDTYEKDMQDIFDQVMDGVAEYHRDTFIDTASGLNALAVKVMDHADLVVVNLSQNQKIIQDYFSHYQIQVEKEKKKVLYLISNYNGNSQYNLKNLCRKYPGLKKHTAVVPYCVDFLDAYSSGKVIPFMARNYGCGEDDSNHFFIHSIKRAVEMIDGCRGEE